MQLYQTKLLQFVIMKMLDYDNLICSWIGPMSISFSCGKSCKTETTQNSYTFVENENQPLPDQSMIDFFYFLHNKNYASNFNTFGTIIFQIGALSTLKQSPSAISAYQCRKLFFRVPRKNCQCYNVYWSIIWKVLSYLFISP